jgi:hypothetical protein
MTGASLDLEYVGIVRVAVPGRAAGQVADHPRIVDRGEETIAEGRTTNDERLPLGVATSSMVSNRRLAASKA